MAKTAPDAIPEPSSGAPSAGGILIGCAAIALAAMAAYSDSFSGPFIFDDLPAIPGNESLHHLASAFVAPSGATVSGRPVLNLSFAVNYAFGGLGLSGYHVVNLLIQICAGWTLFGIVRRTAGRHAPAKIATHATAFALLAALIWTIHPLQTESVTYLVQRAESLMGLFYLLTLYGFIRGVQGSDGRWLALSWVACLLGMGTKEVMVSAPVIVLLYDRTLISGSFAKALRSRPRYYAALALTWAFQAWLVLSTGNRGGTSGFNVGVPPLAYYATQFRAVVRYLELSVWPHPLVLDYGAQWTHGWGEVLPYALVVLLLVAATIQQLVRGTLLGLLGFWFWAILAPTSLIPGTRQTMAEHRMYLGLVPVVLVLLGTLWVAGARLGRARLLLGLAVVVCLGIATYERNEDYRTELSIWSDTAAKNPDNFYAQNNLGNALARLGRFAEAVGRYQKAVELEPNLPEGHNDLGVALQAVDRVSEALPQYEAAIRLKPQFVGAQTNLGAALMRLGRPKESIPYFQAAVKIERGPIEAYNLADAYALTGELPEAISWYRQALSLNPHYVNAHVHLGVALTRSGQLDQAASEFTQALSEDGSDVQARYNLAMIDEQEGKATDAISQFEQVLHEKPDFAEADYNLGLALSRSGQLEEAIFHYREAIRLQPRFADAEDNLGVALARSGKTEEALLHFRRAIEIDPKMARAHENLGKALQSLGRNSAAAEEFAAAARLRGAAPGEPHP